MKKILYAMGFILGYAWFVYSWYAIAGAVHFGSVISFREAFLNWVALAYLVLPLIGIYIGRLVYLKQSLYFPLLYTMWVISWLLYPVAFLAVGYGMLWSFGYVH